tara:strand:- start:2797 stop:3093 length:297 start_codon:yes stop_codon:yes gene_type:complete
MVTIEEIFEVFCKRPYEGEKEISILVVAVREDPLTEFDWSLLDEKISWNAEASDNGIKANNVWEASGGEFRFVFPWLIIRQLAKSTFFNCQNLLCCLV